MSPHQDMELRKARRSLELVWRGAASYGQCADVFTHNYFTGGRRKLAMLRSVMPSPYPAPPVHSSMGLSPTVTFATHNAQVIQRMRSLSHMNHHCKTTCR